MSGHRTTTEFHVLSSFPNPVEKKIMCDTILPRVFPVTVKLDTSVIIVQTLVSKRMMY